MPQTHHNPPLGDIMKLNFNDKTEFEQLEEKAIDGQLDYSEFPPEEYKYFSRLSKLGYNNRHMGWDVKTCTALQEQYRADYRQEKDKADEFLNLSRRIQDNILKSTMLKIEMYKNAENEEQMLDLALQVIELVTNEGGFAKRIKERLKEKNVLNNMCGVW